MKQGINYAAKKTIAASLAAALLGWLLLSLLNLFIIWALRDRASLIRDNDNERILNTLFAEMRNYSELGSAIESNPALLERINGAAVYDSSLQPLQQWGQTPPVFDEEILNKVPDSRFGRYTIPDRAGRSAKFVIRFERPARQPEQQGIQGERFQTERSQAERSQGERFQTERPQAERSQGERFQTERPQAERQATNRQDRRQGDFRPTGEQWFSGLSRGRYIYIDISHTAYWRTRSLTSALFPLVEIILLFLVCAVRFLYLRNREYRKKIKAQENLVVLGTAAGTLAHEIKNPLLSIRLQTGILEKIDGNKDNNEINIINQEVERITSLVYRINDYLREPAGKKMSLNISALVAETAKRICGIDLPPAAPAMIFADEARMRSVLENVMCNAIESGSPVQEIKAELSASENKITIKITDRGQGIDEKNITRVFDPFYTSKSTGTGIGLAISKRFTEAAGGSISIERRKHGGIAVNLVFPLYNGETHANINN